MGLGEWARKAYLPVLAEREDVEIVAVAARSDETRAFARERFGDDIATYDDFTGVAEHPDVDAVMAAVPNRLHAEATEAAISAGKHLFAEPPLGFDAREIGRVFALAARASTIVQTDLELRYPPVVSMVARSVAAGELGDALMAQVRLWCSWGYGGMPWLEAAEEQGFFLWLGCWYLDVLDAVFGVRPSRASVIGGRAHNGDLLDHCWATLEYRGAGLGQFAMSMVAPEEQEVSLRVTGTEGEIIADLWSGAYRRRERGGEWLEGIEPNSQPIHGFAGMRESIGDFLGCIRSGGEPRANLDASRRVHEAALACMRADETGEMVNVESI